MEYEEGVRGYGYEHAEVPEVVAAVFHPGGRWPASTEVPDKVLAMARCQFQCTAEKQR